jgi:putative ABC transport system permease protein
MLIAVYVYDELNYDKYPENAGQIYRVEVNVTGNGGVETYQMLISQWAKE